MRYAAAEKLEIIRLVEQSSLSVWRTLDQLGIFALHLLLLGEVPEPFRVLPAKGFPAVADGPVLALFAEQPFLGSTDARACVADTS
jgi:hypothetical protein